jgi:hypothetical protein
MNGEHATEKNTLPYLKIQEMGRIWQTVIECHTDKI